MTDLTPMMQQYQEIKQAHPETLLFFRLGDFYEMFGEDAQLASKELQITLTGRGPGEKRVPMCGVPYHALDSYLARLIQKGYRVAICEQVEDPKLAKGVVKREVVKVVTPGTAMETGILESQRNNYLLALALGRVKIGLAFADVSTGEFKITSLDNFADLYSEIQRIAPAECLIAPDEISGQKELINFLKKNQVVITPYRYRDIQDQETARNKLLDYFKLNSLAAFGIEKQDSSVCAASAVLEYLKETQKTKLTQISRLTPYLTSEYMFLDSLTRRNLELVQTVRDKEKVGSLLWVLDKTQTAMGSRLLRSWILQPLLTKELIEKRLEAVAELYESALLREEIFKRLAALPDIERLAGKIAAGSANARDLSALGDSLKVIPGLKDFLKDLKSPLLRLILEAPEIWEVAELIEGAIVADPPLTLKEGGLIKSGYQPDLDQIREAAVSGKTWIARLENQERLRTGIKSLKVGFTKIFGYYLEVSTSNLKYVPDDYIRKQTLVNAERFITPQLKEKEALILGADERSKELEYQIFKELRDQVAVYTRALQEISAGIAVLDVLCAFAQTAVEGNYSRPVFNSENIQISQGRHPVVEKMGLSYGFVPNDLNLDNREENFLIMTGPNMAGKSTFLRQAALIILMAQIGSFVPAKSAQVCLLDRIFTRIGAMDDLSAGQSTFMVEMTEVSNILNNATDKSLILLDEIGRGTSTFDGMSIAAAVAEYIYTKIRAKTIFATHYHELTQLALRHDGIKNYNAGVLEEGEKITFLYKILPGPADRSYGIHVATLAGLPPEVVKRAKEVYDTLEMVENGLRVRKDHPHKKTAEPKDQLGLF